MRNRLGLPLLFVIFSLGAEAQPFRAALSGRNVSGCNFLALTQHLLEWLSPDRREGETNVRQIASGRNDEVFGLLFGSGLTIVRVHPTGSQTPFYSDPTASAETFAVGRDGRVYVPLHNGTSFVLAVISADGALEATHPLAVIHHPYNTTIAYDGCTLFLLESFGSPIRRFNACTGSFLPDIFPGMHAEDVEPLPNGQVLLSQDLNVNLYAANGVFIRTVASLSSYGVNGDFVGQISVPNGAPDLWLTSSGCDIQGVLLRVSFDSGALISRFETDLNWPNALVIGNVNAATSDVPLGTNALLLLAIALAAVAVLRL